MGKAVRATRKVRRSQTGQAKKLKKAQRMGNYKKRGAAALAPLTAAAGHSGPMSVVAAGWDRTKTAKQNMLAIGLTSDPKRRLTP